MKSNRVIWPEPVREKLLIFRSEHFTPEETYDFLVQLILEVEDLLLNPVLGKTYREEFGEYKDISRLVVRRFRIYYEQIGTDLIVLAVKFPGEK
jgi:plasmid stabilization system protein ParE